MGECGGCDFPTVSKCLSCGQLVCFERFVRPAKTLWKFLDFSIICSLFEAIFSQDIAKEGSYLSGIFHVLLSQPNPKL